MLLEALVPFLPVVAAHLVHEERAVVEVVHGKRLLPRRFLLPPLGRVLPEGVGDADAVRVRAAVAHEEPADPGDRALVAGEAQSAR